MGLRWPAARTQLFTYNNPNRKVANSILAGLLFYPSLHLVATTKLSFKIIWIRNLYYNPYCP